MEKTGVEKRRFFRTKRAMFTVVLLVVFAVIFFFVRYTTILNILKIIPFRYFQFVNLLSVLGLSIAVLGFYKFDKLFKINFKQRHYIFIIFMTLIALSLSFLYFNLAHFDKFQHFFFPMMAGSLVFHMVSKLDLELRYKLLFTFTAVISIIAVFELTEYFLDYFFDLYLQGAYLGDPKFSDEFQILFSPIDDTMIDLLLGFLGSLTYVFSVYFLFEKK